jgi:hypothetical protein
MDRPQNTIQQTQAWSNASAPLGPTTKHKTQMTPPCVMIWDRQSQNTANWYHYESDTTPSPSKSCQQHGGTTHPPAQHTFHTNQTRELSQHNHIKMHAEHPHIFTTPTPTAGLSRSGFATSKLLPRHKHMRAITHSHTHVYICTCTHAYMHTSMHTPHLQQGHAVTSHRPETMAKQTEPHTKA